jgi:aldose 1-epimerase
MTDPSLSANLEQVDGIEIVRLADRTRAIEIRIAPSIGNIAYAFTVNGQNALWFPYASPAELKAKPVLCGIPFLAPWANRIDGDSYWVNGREYRLNPALANLRRDSHQKPIHGLLLFSPFWVRESYGADASSAWSTSRLEFWKYPELMAQFPFAHDIVMTHRLENGALQVETTLGNLSTEPMPVAVGFHPYFQLHDCPRDDWSAHLPAREHLLLDSNLIPTGACEPSPFPDPHLLRTRPLDDGFASLVSDADGRARFWVAGKKQKITVAYGPQFPIAVVYAPAGHDYICFEPMSAPTNAFNLAHSGLWLPPAAIPPGDQWTESFWVQPDGF